MTETDTSEQEEQSEQQTDTQEKNSKLSYIMLAVLFGVLLLVSFSLWVFTQNVTRTTDINTLPTANSSKSGLSANYDPSFCKNNTKRHSLQEALVNPSEVCALKLIPEDEVTFITQRSHDFIHLESIYFDGNDASIPPEIGNITSLKVLNFHHTVNTTLPPEIGKLQNLTTFRLSKTDITTFPPEIGNMNKLTHIIIMFNTKPITIPPAIGKLVNLQVLTLRENTAISLPSALSNNQNIESLELTNNKLDELPAFVYQLPRLHTLTLSANKINILSPDINKLRQLKALRAANNELQSFPSVGELENLEALNLSDNDLTQLPQGIENPKKLKYLNVSGNTIKKSDMEALKRMLPQAQIVY